MNTASVISAVRESVGKTVVGNTNAADLLLITLFSGGHALIEDVPGTGKTVMVKALAASVACSFGRIQFTPDLLPSDITGVNYFNMKSSEFEFLPGPVFSNILLADEINRATPKTQSGLLECMQERQVTIDGVTYALESPFMVVATQNPVENMGTFPLPEAQLDRFLVKLSLGYPGHEQNMEILRRFEKKKAIETPPVLTKDDIRACSEALTSVYVNDDLISYITSVCELTRNAPGVILGASPRAAMALLDVARGFALLGGRDYCVPDDIKKSAVPVLAHRLVLSASERIRKNAAENVIKAILERLPVPTEGVFDGGITGRI